MLIYTHLLRVSAESATLCLRGLLRQSGVGPVEAAILATYL